MSNGHSIWLSNVPARWREELLISPGNNRSHIGKKIILPEVRGQSTDVGTIVPIDGIERAHTGSLGDLRNPIANTLCVKESRQMERDVSSRARASYITSRPEVWIRVSRGTSGGPQRNPRGRTPAL